MAPTPEMESLLYRISFFPFFIKNYTLTNKLNLYLKHNNETSVLLTFLNLLIYL